MMPVDAVLAVTYRCNARCEMCGIWKSKLSDELPPEVYGKLPPGLRDINLTGGEPFLRQDLVAVHAATKNACPKAQTVISTNGLLKDRILAAVRGIAKAEPNVGVAVSLDGPADIHDRLRGVRGAYDKALATVKALQDAGCGNLRLAFTATPVNVRYLQGAYEQARDMGVQFTCAIEHGSPHYFHTEAPKQGLRADELCAQLEPVIRSELRSFSPKRWARAYFMLGLYEFSAGRGRLLPCRAGRDFFFMDPSGEVYTCNAAPFAMGNLREQEFDELWNSSQAVDARRQAGQCEAGCWMICTARTAIKRAWLRVLGWALLHKASGVSLGVKRP